MEKEGRKEEVEENDVSGRAALALSVTHRVNNRKMSQWCAEGGCWCGGKFAIQHTAERRKSHSKRKHKGLSYTPFAAPRPRSFAAFT
jgi:hypothetical protein